jgi:nucleoside diphosphate kinase
MTSLMQLLERRAAGLTVYSPDCTQSRLWGHLDHAIHDAAGFRAVYRQWINHDINSVMRFYLSGSDEPLPEEDPVEGAKKYDNIPVEELHYGHLVAKMFLSGPSLLTIWLGDNAVETLLTLKGATHPAEASPESIRGRFWCDNAVCNLMHASDDYQEAERELRAINLSDLLETDLTGTTLPLIEMNAIVPNYVAHSGISVLCSIVKRMLMVMDDEVGPDVQLPTSGDSKETNHVLSGVLQETSQRLHGSVLAQLIDAYMTGDLITTTALLKEMPVTKWEHFIIQCGVITRDKWNN